MWDDSDMAPFNIGGRCLNSWQASKRLKDGRGGLQEVTVQLSHDANLAGDHALRMPEARPFSNSDWLGD